jgi:predicted Zn finger-like uncharacterized protein
MLISCPACDKKYMIDDATIKDKGRKVRCGACGNIWFHEAVEPLNLVPEAAPVQEAPQFRSNNLPSLPYDDEEEIDTSKTGIYAWIKKYYIDWLIICFAIIAIIGITLYERGSFFESPTSSSAPKPHDTSGTPSQPHGDPAKPASGSGLSISSVRYALDNSQAPQQILVTGEVINNTKETLSVPQLRITVHAQEKVSGVQPAAANAPLNAYTWKHQPANHQILPGERIVFKSTMPSPGWANINKLYVAFDKQQQ